MTIPTYHQFNCGPMLPSFPRIQGGTYCILLETNKGNVLIDSGYGIHDFTQPAFRTRVFTNFVQTPRDTQNCLTNQLKNGNIDPHSVKHIILTHMHLDHAGGVADFPWATVHVHQKECQAATQKKGKLGIGYLDRQWKQHQHWQFYNQSDTTWFGFEAIMLTGFQPEIFLIPTPGHSPGHCMVAFGTDDQWVLQTGSAGFPFWDDENNQPIHLPNWFQRLAMGPYLSRLKQLWVEHHNHITFLSGHDFIKRVS